MITKFGLRRHAARTVVAAAFAAMGLSVANAAPMNTVTIDFGTAVGASSRYFDDEFRVIAIGSDVTSYYFGNPGPLVLDENTPFVSIGRGFNPFSKGAFSLKSFDIFCVYGECEFKVDGYFNSNWLRQNSRFRGTSTSDFVTFTPSGFGNMTFITFEWISGAHRIDNIVLGPVVPIPLPAPLALLASGLLGLGAVRRFGRRRPASA